MGSILLFSAVNSKMHTMQSKLLKKADFEKLIEINNFKDALAYLVNNTGYKDAFIGADINNVKIEDVEAYLKKNYIKNFRKLQYYFFRNYNKLIKTLFMRYEIEDLKTIIRGKYRNQPPEQIKKFMMYENALSSFNYDELINEKDIASVIQALKNTKYYNHIHPLVKDIDEKGLFALETYLDFKYFSQIRDIVKKIKREDRKVMQREVGIYIDLLNIQWIYRGIKFYNVSKEELFNYIIYDGHELDNEFLKKLCYVENLEQFKEILKTTPYGNIIKEIENEDYLFEREILDYIKQRYFEINKESKMNISILMSFLEISLIEIRDIITILESKRYTFNKEETLKYITTI